MDHIKSKLKSIRETAENKKIMAATDLLEVIEMIVDEMEQGVDYKELLRKYIKHVDECEGTNFIHHTSFLFSEKELITLKHLAESVNSHS